MKHPQTLATALLVALAACSSAESQGNGTLTLDKKLPAQFTQLSNVVGLDGDRVAFAETQAKVFLAADLASGKIDTLGTRVDSIKFQSAPGEYKFPGWVARLAGDTVALVDFAAQRTTLWDQRGQPLAVLPLPPVSGPTPVLAYDAVGHGYKVDYQALLGGNEPGNPVRPDSVSIFRIDLRTRAVDTVGKLSAPDYGDALFGEQTQTVAKIYSPNDLFGVLPDGSLWIARGRQNRVDWRSPEGKWTRGKPHELTAVPVTQEDKDRFLRRMRERGLQESVAVVFPFADDKPPFEFAMGRPNGEVWLQRSRATESEAIVYDVVDRRGRWRREIAFPVGAMLAGFGNDGAIYATMKEGERRTVGRFVIK